MELIVRVDKLESINNDQITVFLKTQAYEWLYSFEISEETKKHHFHYYLRINSPKNPETLMKAVRTKLKAYGCVASQFSVAMCKDTMKYITYIMKDGDYESNFKEEELQKFKIENDRINTEKKMSMRDKVLEHVRPYLLKVIEELKEDTSSWSSNDNTWLTQTIKEINRNVVNYYKERKLLPPTTTLFKQYMMYIFLQSGIERLEQYATDSYYCLI